VFSAKTEIIPIPLSFSFFLSFFFVFLKKRLIVSGGSSTGHPPSRVKQGNSIGPTPIGAIFFKKERHQPAFVAALKMLGLWVNLDRIFLVVRCL
jgi:hypothetical protein